MSAKPPQTYILHAVGIAIVLVICMVLFLRHSWGHH
jgi:hypothetical protein